MKPKRVDHRKITGQLGVNLIERTVLRMKYLWHPSNSELDVGIDGVIEVCDPATGEATNCIVQVQSKSLSQFTAETDSQFEFLCDQRDLDYWLAGNTPVILVITRRDSEEAYWVPVKSYFDTPEKRKTRRFFIDKSACRFNESCAGALRDLAVPRDAGLYFAPAPQEETLISNLLPVTELPEHLYLAHTSFRTAGQVWYHARSAGLRITGEWVLKHKQILSVHNLREEPWSQLCDPGTAERFDADEWIRSTEPQQKNEFLQLLYHCLRELLGPHDVVYNKSLDLFYFKANSALSPRRLSYPSLKNLTDKTVFGPYESKTKAGRIAYYRHSAFRGAFRRFDDVWYLEVTPTYFFSSDGRRESRYAAERTSGIKRLERNRAVLGQLLMWAEVLTQGPTLFRPDAPVLKIARPDRFSLNVGLDDAEWLRHEEDSSRGATLKDDLLEARLFEA
jgi:hypothetical protein